MIRNLRLARLLRISVLFILLATLFFTAGCSSTNKTATIETENGLQMAGHAMLTDEIKDSATTVRDAYRFAIANPNVLKELPCYCGCGAVGHTSNYACYVKDDSDPGNLVFDDHALGCTICVDITVDAMRMMRDGKGLTEIRAFVDQTYSQYGPSNIP